MATRLRRHVTALADTIGERNIWHPDGLAAAATYIDKTFAGFGHEVSKQVFDAEGLEVMNLDVEIRGTSRPDEIIVIGAHYDSVLGSPGANDNASGVAAVLEIARVLSNKHPARTIRLVAFVNEEPPFFQSNAMGSKYYAARSRKNDENVVAMISLETIGYYSDKKGSQRYPFPLNFFYPKEGNFIGFVSNLSSRSLLGKAAKVFEETSSFPLERAAVPGWLAGIGWSDHWAFWKEGYKAMMVTDTALFRYPFYHTPQDTADKLDYERFAKVVLGLAGMVEGLAAAPHK